MCAGEGGETVGWLNGWHMTVPVFLHVYNTIKLRLPLATKGGTAHEFVCMCVCVCMGLGGGVAVGFKWYNSEARVGFYFLKSRKLNFERRRRVIAVLFCWPPS